MELMARGTRFQALIGQILMVLALLIALPVAKPTLWPLEVWGGLHVWPFVWAAAFFLTGLILTVCRRPRWTVHAMRLAVVLLGTVAGAAYMSLGTNAFTAVAAILTLHALGASTELRDAARRICGRG